MSTSCKRLRTAGSHKVPRGSGKNQARDLALAWFISFAACQAMAEGPSQTSTATPEKKPAPILAVIDGVALTTNDLEAALDATGPRRDIILKTDALKQRFLQGVVDERLIARLGERAGIALTEEYARRVEHARAQILADLYKKARLKASNTRERQKALFERDPRRFSEREVRASHLLFADLAQAQLVLSKALEPGADFSAIQEAHLQNHKNAGGDLGFFGRGRMLPPFEAAAFATPPGSIHPQVVHTSFGYHIIKVSDSRGADLPSFTEVQPAVEEALLAEEEAAIRADALKGAKIEVRAQNLHLLSH